MEMSRKIKITDASVAVAEHLIDSLSGGRGFVESPAGVCLLLVVGGKMKKEETMKKKETLTIEISEEKINGLKFYSACIPEINSAIIGTGDTKKDALIDLCRIYFLIKDEDVLEGILPE